MSDETMGSPAPAGPPPTPELDKMKKARDEGSETIGEFLEWLQEQGLTLCEYIEGYDDEPERWRPAQKGIQRLLADFYSIDLVKVEQERMAVLAYLRSRQ